MRLKVCGGGLIHTVQAGYSLRCAGTEEARGAAPLSPAGLWSSIAAGGSWRWRINKGAMRREHIPANAWINQFPHKKASARRSWKVGTCSMYISIVFLVFLLWWCPCLSAERLDRYGGSVAACHRFMSWCQIIAVVFFWLLQRIYFIDLRYRPDLKQC